MPRSKRHAELSQEEKDIINASKRALRWEKKQEQNALVPVQIEYEEMPLNTISLDTISKVWGRTNDESAGSSNHQRSNRTSQSGNVEIQNSILTQILLQKKPYTCLLILYSFS